ncbi:hypothetical protein UlMin_041587 [Ulmus minor]
MNASMDVHDHGRVVDYKMNKVECIYCAKVVSCGFYRLKRHLGGIGGDVRACEKVPAAVRNAFKDLVNQRKKENLAEQNLPQKMNWSTRSTSGTAGSCSQVVEKMEFVLGDLMAEHAIEPSQSPCSQIGRNEKMSTDSVSWKLEKCIGHFFYENGIDLSAANSPSFKELIDLTIGLVGPVEFKIPNYKDLNGRMLHDEVREMKEYVNKIKSSWEITGCSILLDGWTDAIGRNLINILADCPKGPIYLHSFDISAFIGDTESLQWFLETIIEDVGVDNVVQIVAHSTRGWVEDVVKQFMDRCKRVFWTVSASHCIDLMLEEIGLIASIREVLDKAKTITKLIHSRAELLELLKKHTGGRDIVKPSKIKSAIPFLILYNIIQEKQNLKDMFGSLEWKTSICDCQEEGKRVVELVQDHSFWIGAEMALKATMPLVRVQNLIFETDKPLVGFIYEIMDRAKETIREEFQNESAQYMPFWLLIDEIWNNKLHSPIHGAGYYLNPGLFYSTEFYGDEEVTFGLFCCVERIVQDQESQDLLTQQLEEYRHSKGGFEERVAIDQGTKISPSIWWSNYEKEYPELHKFAIRILSQDCSGASKYGLKRSMAENLLASERNPIEQQRLLDLAFVHYNLHLRQFHSGKKGDILAEEIDSLNEWITLDE